MPINKDLTIFQEPFYTKDTFQVGETVKCIDITYTANEPLKAISDLTLGKNYKILSISHDEVENKCLLYIKDDNDCIIAYRAERFQKVSHNPLHNGLRVILINPAPKKTWDSHNYDNDQLNPQNYTTIIKHGIYQIKHCHGINTTSEIGHFHNKYTAPLGKTYRAMFNFQLCPTDQPDLQSCWFSEHCIELY